jgi:hypothetical protein
MMMMMMYTENYARSFRPYDKLLENDLILITVQITLICKITKLTILLAYIFGPLYVINASDLYAILLQATFV